MTGIYKVYTWYKGKKEYSRYIPGKNQSKKFKKNIYIYLEDTRYILSESAILALEYTWNIPGLFLKC